MSNGGALDQSAQGMLAAEQASQDKIRVRQVAACCPSCNEEVLPGAVFCVECGHSLGCPCPQCGAEAGGFDFCEACGYWLKEGQCRFCYTELPEGAAFCTECGTSQQGLRCTRCNTTGFFDFCGGCGEALSDLAQSLAQMPPDDPMLVEALQQLKELEAASRQTVAQFAAAPSTSGPALPAVSPQAALGLNLSGALKSMRAFSVQDAAAAERARQDAEQSRQEAQALASAATALALQSAHEHALQDARREEMAQSQATALGLSVQLQQARERIKVLMTASEQRSFPDAQTARRHFMQLRSHLIREGQVPTQWLCNWADCKHDNPNDCGNPTLGGRWLFD